MAMASGVGTPEAIEPSLVLSSEHNLVISVPQHERYQLQWTVPVIFVDRLAEQHRNG